MKFPALALLSIVLGLASGHELPSFSWDGTRSSESGIPHLVIQFPDGSSDAAVLSRVNPVPLTEGEKEEDLDPCIFEGHLENDPEIPIAVSGGCPFSSSFEVTLMSSKVKGPSFIVQNHNVKRYSAAQEGFIHDYIKVAEDQPAQNERLNKVFPTKGFKLLMKVFLVSNFVENFEDDRWNVLRRSMVHCQAFYYHPSLKTKIRIQVQETGEIPNDITAKDLGIARQYSVHPDYHANIYLAWQETQDGTLGQAYIKTVCSSPSMRSGVCEWWLSDVQAGATIAHELGHILGMSHDFVGNGQPRYDSKGVRCTGVNGVMDYTDEERWSTCSVEDFYNYYNSYRYFCLREDFNPLT